MKQAKVTESRKLAPRQPSSGPLASSVASLNPPLYDIELADYVLAADPAVTAAGVILRGNGAPQAVAPGLVVGGVPVLTQGSIGRVQAKLIVGPAHDRFEQEADQISDRVLRMTAPAIHAPHPSGVRDRIQRTCAACSEPALEELQRKATDASGFLVAAPTRATTRAAGELTALRAGGGAPLSAADKAFFEPRFGDDFATVRIHVGPDAHASAAEFGARAYTVGNDIVFAEGQFAPNTIEGKRLLAHELAHVVQQRAGDTFLRRQTCPSPRAPNEVRQSATTGFIDPDAVFTPSLNRLEIFDFAVNSAVIPAGATALPDWERAMSIMAGDPTIRVAVTGFTDCVGTQPENLALRRQRVASVMAAIPPTVRSRVLFSFTITTTDYVDPTNATPEARARNRSVRVTFQSLPPTGTDPCDAIPQAQTIDEFLFLVRCMERRLNLTSPADAPRALSVLRQIYYGSSAWTVTGGRNPIWASVIPTRPWPAATDPSTTLGPLFGALQRSQTVGGIDIGHVLAGLDGMMAPGNVGLQLGRITWGTSLPREEWATWAGDVGAAAADWVVDTVYGAAQTPATLDARFAGHASDDDLRGDVDSFAMRVGLTGGSASASLGRAIRLTGTLSEALLQYYRITSSAPGRAQARHTQIFIEAYGGSVSGNRIVDQAALAARLRPSVQEFAFYYMMQALLRRGYLAGGPSPPGPAPASILDFAVTEMTNRFIQWLNAHP